MMTTAINWTAHARFLGHTPHPYQHSDGTDYTEYCGDCGALGSPDGEGDLYSESCEGFQTNPADERYPGPWTLA